MSDYDIDKLRQAFHINPIQTRGTRKGIILKFPFFYIKIYDGNEQSTYSVQVWQYGTQLPYTVQEVRSENLISFIKDL